MHRIIIIISSSSIMQYSVIFVMNKRFNKNLLFYKLFLKKTVVKVIEWVLIF